MPDRVLHVLVVTGDDPQAAELIGDVRVEVEATGDDIHDAKHAILQAGFDIGDGAPVQSGRGG